MCKVYFSVLIYPLRISLFKSYFIRIYASIMLGASQEGRFRIRFFFFARLAQDMSRRFGLQDETL